MITKFKIYESVDAPKIGDYVICRDMTLENYTNENETLNFLANNIGQISRFTSAEDDVLTIYKYFITFDNIPKNISHNFNIHDKYKSGRAFSKDEIIYSSPNKKDVEIFLVQNKYNL